MSNPLPSGHKGKQKECDRCGFVKPLDKLQYQRGVLVCKDCYDEEDYEDDDR